jgi:hypothetical protein
LGHPLKETVAQNFDRHLKASDWTEAEHIATAALQRWPNDPDINTWIPQIRFCQQKLQEEKAAENNEPFFDPKTDQAIREFCKVDQRYKIELIAQQGDSTLVSVKLPEVTSNDPTAFIVSESKKSHTLHAQPVVTAQCGCSYVGTQYVRKDIAPDLQLLEARKMQDEDSDIDVDVIWNSRTGELIPIYENAGFTTKFVSSTAHQMQLLFSDGPDIGDMGSGDSLNLMTQNNTCIRLEKKLHTLQQGQIGSMHVDYSLDTHSTPKVTACQAQSQQNIRQRENQEVCNR